MLFLKATNSYNGTIDAKYYNYKNKDIVDHRWSFAIGDTVNLQKGDDVKELKYTTL